MQHRYGGYWRYPRLIDFSYLVNPYFPSSRMKDELRANFDTLLTQYPSGMRVNSLLAAKNFNVRQEYIVVGNGASELIKSLMSSMSGKIGFIKPTFEEYPNRYPDEQQIIYKPDNNDYSYSASDVMHFFDDKDIAALILINPDNPSGNYIKKDDSLKLIEWAKHKNIRLIIDESFVDFSDEKNPSLLSNEILQNNPHLFVMKSISKSYGVPGLRLGILASGDKTAIEAIKKDVAIWNINSFAEFYMQIEGKYQKDYSAALKEFREERKRFESELSAIDGIRVIPSQANYVLIELGDGISSKNLLKRLIIKYQILVKELTSKLDNDRYLRIAIRDTVDNNKLLSALRQELVGDWGNEQ